MPPEAPPIISFSEVTATLGGRTILDRLSWTLREGECAVVFGQSGSGKSVFLSLLLGFLKPNAGQVQYFGELHHDFFGQVAVLFQEDALLGDRTVETNLAIALLERLDVFSGPFEGDVQTAIDRTLREVGLEPDVVRAVLPSALSGGMRRRVALARTLIRSPKVLIADEPTSGLDAETSRVIHELMAEVIRKNNMSAVIVTHDAACVELLGDPVYYFTPKAGELARRPKAEGPSVPDDRIDSWIRSEKEKYESAYASEDKREPTGTSSVFTIESAKQEMWEGIGALGRALLLTRRVFDFGSPRLLLHHLQRWGVGSFGLVVLIFFLLGVVLEIQSEEAIIEVGFSNRLPELFALGLTRVSPIVCAVLMAGRCGSAISAQTGWMTLSGQNRALRTMRLDPDREIFAPVFWSWVIALPLLAGIGAFVAAFAGWSLLASGIARADITARFFTSEFVGNLEASELWIAFAKAVVMAAGCATIAYAGASSPKRSTSDVSRSMTRGLVLSFIWIGLVDTVLSLAGSF